MKDFWLAIVGHFNTRLGMVGDKAMVYIGCPVSDIQPYFRVLKNTVTEKTGLWGWLIKPNS